MKYESNLHIKSKGSGMWELLSEFRYTYKGSNYTIPIGFPTDLASIPPFVSCWLKPDGVYKESAVIHDWLLKRMYNGDTSITRRYAAKVFLDSLIYQNIPKHEIAVLYTGVRIYDLYKFIKKSVLK